jgi:hypothetical protein
MKKLHIARFEKLLMESNLTEALAEGTQPVNVYTG